MGWAKLDDGFATNPKVVAAGLEGAGLDAKAFSHCAKHETDGFVTDSDLLGLAAGARNPKKVAQRLVEVGRWERDDERKGYWVHDYLKYNPSRAELEARRKKDRRRKGSERKPQGQDKDSSGTPLGIHVDSEEIPSGPTMDSERTDAGIQVESGWKPLGLAHAEPDPTRSDVSQVTPYHPGVVPPDESFRVGKRVDDEPETGVTGYRQGSKITDDLARRLAGVCTADNRRLVDGEARQVVEHVLGFVDWRVVDEAIGAYGASSGKLPTLPRALVPAVRARAPDLELPEFQPGAVRS